MKEEHYITTKQFVSRLLELDPSGNKEIYLEVLGDDYYSHGLRYESDLQADDEHNIINLYV